LNGNTPAVYGLFDFTYSGTKDVETLPAAVIGDGRPDDLDNLATPVANFSSILTFGVTDPRSIAAARDSNDATAGSTPFTPGDNRNLVGLLSLRSRTLSFSAGSNYTFSGTIDDEYKDTITKVSTLKSASDLNLKVAQDSYLAAANRRDEESGVSLDEEFTGLI